VTYGLVVLVFALVVVFLVGRRTTEHAVARDPENQVAASPPFPHLKQWNSPTHRTWLVIRAGETVA
jgi:hypothetical protein